MNKLYLAKSESVHERCVEILTEIIGAPAKILRTENGKPYIEGNPLFFSISHSGTRALIAVCDKPVGVDLELFKNSEHHAVFKSFSEREQAEINCERDFLLHWTAREAYIKMRGETLAACFKKLEFFGDEIYLDGIKQNCKIQAHTFGFGVATVCIEL